MMEFNSPDSIKNLKLHKQELNFDRIDGGQDHQIVPQMKVTTKFIDDGPIRYKFNFSKPERRSNSCENLTHFEGVGRDNF